MRERRKRERRDREQSGPRRSGTPTAESSSRGIGRRGQRSEHATQTHVRQSSMYSDRPRWVRGGRAANLTAREAAAEGRTNDSLVLYLLICSRHCH
ncbi:hypothetical protein PVAP13_3KG228753 [Panicum virgatum]|uniref:Uncharacterized protein n=1 Tax=Panicum virgatum TaxID=38727 RepID=A0A8T0UV14_PANVG|nr:hypothetical protein PVAP13_3KG228753 [Panicum virgatum]